MKIKNKLIVTYSTIILAVGSLTFFILISGFYRLNNKNIKISREGINKIIAGNNELSKIILTKVGETLVNMRCEIVANKLRWTLQKTQKPYNYDELRNNPQIIALATQKIYVPIENRATLAGRMDLVDINGMSVIHSDKLIEGKNFNHWAKKYPKMWALVKESFTKSTVNGYYIFIDKDNIPVKKYMELRRIKNTPFIICASVEINQYFIPLIKEVENITKSHTNIIENKMDKNSEEILSTIQINVIYILITIIAIGVIISIWQAQAISNPIQMLCKNVRKMGKGNFGIQILQKGPQEIVELGVTFNMLGGELTTYMDNLKNEIVKRQTIESEIAITRTIQESLLPHTFPPFPMIKSFDLHATLIPAKEVSGDFYDFFFVNDDILAITIADVSGKGLPASLFMAVSRTLLRNLCMHSENYSPAKILKKANDYLCQDNDECMFVTTFLAFYNIKSGVLKYGNAGHCEAISYLPTAELKLFGSFPDLPLGVLENYEYQEAEHILSKNESLILYTDGVTEAINEKKELYGLHKFKEEISKTSPNSELKTMIDNVNNSLKIYQGDKQFDDITILILRRNL